jgi:hypothetical protein
MVLVRWYNMGVLYPIKVQNVQRDVSPSQTLSLMQVGHMAYISSPFLMDEPRYKHLMNLEE